MCRNSILKVTEICSQDTKNRGETDRILGEKGKETTILFVCLFYFEVALVWLVFQQDLYWDLRR